MRRSAASLSRASLGASTMLRSESSISSESGGRLDLASAPLICPSSA